MGANRDDLARRHASKAIELDAAAPGGHEILAYLAAEARSAEEVKQHAEAALRNGSKDSDMFLLMGNSFISGQNGNQNRPDADRQRANLYASAIKLNPRRLASYERLTEAMFGGDKSHRGGCPPPWPRHACLSGRGLDPRGFRGSRIPARQTRAGPGDHGRALRSDSTLDGQQRPYADRIQRGWLYDTMNDEIRDAVGRRDLAAARAVLDKYRGAIAGDPRADTLLQQIDADLKRRS